MHAEIARELARDGDPRVLRLNGVRYIDKPPLLYALVAGAFSLAGQSEAAARAVPALAALVAVGATAWLGGRLLGGASGLVAGLALASAPGFFAYGRYVRPETLFVAALATGFALVLDGVLKHRRWRVAFGLGAFGLAALAKDPLGLLAPPLAIGAAMVLTGRGRPLGRWLPWPGVVLGAVVGLGWWGAAELATPGITWYTVVDNHVLNVARARLFPDEDVSLGALEFVAVALLGMGPWVLAAAVALFEVAFRPVRGERRELAWAALALWAIGVLGLTTLSAFRLPHYGLPAYPALALLATRAWSRARGLGAAYVMLFVAAALACGLAWSSDGGWFMEWVLGATDVATRKSAVAGAGAPVPPWSALRPLLAASAAVFAAGALALGASLSLRRRSAHAADPLAAPVSPSGSLPRLALWVVVGTQLALLPVVAQALTLVSSHRAVTPIALEIARGAGPDDLVVHEGPLENSGALEWYSGRRPVIVDGRRSVLGFGATLDESRDVFWELDRLARAWTSPRRVWLVTGRAAERSVVQALGGARLVAAAGGRRLYVNR